MNFSVKSGDTYWGLSQKYGTTVAEISAANPGVNYSNLKIGQSICVPTLPTGTSFDWSHNHNGWIYKNNTNPLTYKSEYQK